MVRSLVSPLRDYRKRDPLRTYRRSPAQRNLFLPGLFRGAGLRRKFVEGMRHLQESRAIVRIGGALGQRKTFRRIASIIFRRASSRVPYVPVANRCSDVGFRASQRIWAANGFRPSDVYGSNWEAEDQMQDAKSYRQYANDCRRIADTMNAKDKAIMLEMAKVWDDRADEAARIEKDKGAQD
jgi:hypothetical protein